MRCSVSLNPFFVRNFIEKGMPSMSLHHIPWDISQTSLSSGSRFITPFFSSSSCSLSMPTTSHIVHCVIMEWSLLTFTKSPILRSFGLIIIFLFLMRHKKAILHNGIPLEIKKEQCFCTAPPHELNAHLPCHRTLVHYRIRQGLLFIVV